MQTKFGQDVALKDIEGRQQKELKSMDISGEQVKAAAAARNAQALELFKHNLQDAPSGSQREKTYIDFINAVNKDGTLEPSQILDLYFKQMNQVRNPGTPAPQPQSQNVGNTGMRITPAQ